MLNKPNAQELTQLARKAGALVLRSPLLYPGPEMGNWEIGAEILSDYLYEFRDREVLVILAAVDGDPVHLCSICGFPLSKPAQPCPRCALIDEDMAAEIDRKRTVADVEEWLKGQRLEPPPHSLEVEIEKLQRTLEALEAYPPLWWVDRLLWRSLRWFYRMRLRRLEEARK